VIALKNFIHDKLCELTQSNYEYKYEKYYWTRKGVRATVLCMGNVSTNVCAKFRCAPLRIKKALGIFGPLKNWFQEEQLAFCDPPSGTKNDTV